MKSWEKVFHANGDQKKAEVAILISDKIDFETKTTKRDKGHYIMIKESLQEEDITIINIWIWIIYEYELKIYKYMHPT